MDVMELLVQKSKKTNPLGEERKSIITYTYFDLILEHTESRRAEIKILIFTHYPV